MNWQKFDKPFDEMTWSEKSAAYVVGRILRDKDGGTELVGDTNVNGGYCDCCGGGEPEWVEYCDDFITAIFEART